MLGVPRTQRRWQNHDDADPHLVSRPILRAGRDRGYDVFEHALEVAPASATCRKAPALPRHDGAGVPRFIADIRKIPNGSVRTRRLKESSSSAGSGIAWDFLIGELSRASASVVGLAGHPARTRVLILDEPTSRPGPNQIVEIRQVIKHIGESKTVISRPTS